MSNYTPTTEEVRNWYTVGKHEFETAPYSSSEQEFDRWLRAVKAEAVQEFIVGEVKYQRSLGGNNG